MSDERRDKITALADDVQEYLHWRKVNPQIKGGENYLKRLSQSLAASNSESVDKYKKLYERCRYALKYISRTHHEGEIIRNYADATISGFDHDDALKDAEKVTK